MRPIKLDIEGFTAFRERTVVEFDEADLFVLCGPTGSGKSSLIDAMTFALYGSIPRYNNPSLVYPVVSQGLQEARVRFDFMIQNKPYTAVRVVRRQKRGDTWGALTKEARLESGTRDLAVSAKELDEQVHKLFGLNFDQFTTCVVLPQGEFARFLNAAPANRQSLLKELLRIFVYAKMRQLAHQRQASAKQLEKIVNDQLDGFADATAEAKKTAKERVKVLTQLRKSVEKNQSELNELELERKRQVDAVNTEAEKAKLLKSIEQPEGVESIVSDQKRINELVKKREQLLVEAEKKLSVEEAEFQKLPESGPLNDFLALYRQRGDEEENLDLAKKAALISEKAFRQAESALRASKKELELSDAKVKELQRHHTAYHLAEELAPGEPCPVCFRPLDSVPEHPLPTDVANAQKELEKAKANVSVAEKSYQTAVTTNSTNASRLADLEGRIAAMNQRLKGAPAIEELQKQIEINVEAAKRVEKARKAADDDRKAERDAREQLKKTELRLKEAWNEYDRKRDLVASFQPPSANREDLNLSWKKLVDWASKYSLEATEKIQQLKKKTATLEEEIRSKRESLAEICAEAGIEIETRGDVRDAVVDAHVRAQESVKQVEQAIEKRAELEKKREEAKTEAAVSGTLARHLSANAFERWLLQEAFEHLVSEGSRKLQELSGGDYSFQLDEQLNFDIIDHRNADETRSSKTLSGGETFLASLALALTLSEQVADLASAGAARLESIFLDEGFGSLDPDTLEIVHATIEELGARGRIVGLITHVKELAERIPVQYRVSKGPKSATVEKFVL